MAAAGIAPESLPEVMTLVASAYMAMHKQRFARAAELFGRAAARTVAAGAPPDSLVLASLRVTRSNALEALSQVPASAAEAPALSAEAYATVREVTRTVCARADAGTLLPGTLRADELAFGRARVVAKLRAQFPEKLGNAAFVANATANASLLGYATALECVAATVARLELTATKVWLPPLAGSELDAAQAFLLRATALVTQVRHDFAMKLSSEVQLAFLVSDLADPRNRASIRGPVLDARFYDALMSAWRAPEFLAALNLHGSMGEATSGSCEAENARAQARAAADVAAVGLRTCALPACGAREATVRQFKVCSGCRRVAYCCAEHAKAHWKAGHKRECSHAL